MLYSASKKKEDTFFSEKCKQSFRSWKRVYVPIESIDDEEIKREKK